MLGSIFEREQALPEFRERSENETTFVEFQDTQHPIVLPIARDRDGLRIELRLGKADERRKRR